MAIKDFGLFAAAAAGAGATYLWGNPGRLNFLDRVFPNWSRGNSKAIASFFVYMILGGVLTLIVVDPQSLRHALAGGIAWRAVLTIRE